MGNAFVKALGRSWFCAKSEGFIITSIKAESWNNKIGMPVLRKRFLGEEKIIKSSRTGAFGIKQFPCDVRTAEA